MREYRDSVASNPSESLPFYQPLDWLISKAGLVNSFNEDVPLPEGYSMNPDEAEDVAIQGPATDPAKVAWDEHTSSVLTDDFVESFRNNYDKVTNNVKRPIVPFS